MLANEKVTLITHGLAYGGAQISTLELLKLTKKYFDYHVITCDNANKLFVRTLDELKVKTIRVPCNRMYGYPLLLIDKIEEAVKVIKESDLIWLGEVEYAVVPIIKRINKDSIIIAYLRSFALICPYWSACYGYIHTCWRKCNTLRIIKCRVSTVKTLYNLGLTPLYKTIIKVFLDPIRGIIRYSRVPFNDKVIKLIDGFIAVSNFVKKIVIRHYPLIINKPFEVVYSPVLIETSPKLDGENEKNTIVYASGKWPHKGPHVLLAALRILINNGFNDLKLIMIGCRDDKWIDSLVKKMGLEKNVELYSKLRIQDVHSLMNKSSLVVMPSICPEALGRVPIEANKLGIPAIVSNRGGLPETVVDRVTGLIIEPDPRQLANAIKEALTKIEWDHRKISDLAYKRFDPNKQAEKFCKFITNMIIGKK